MKTIIARFTELKENVDDSGEDLESMDFNKVDKALKSVGVQLKDTTGSFRNLDDVFLELSSKWDTLTRNQQRYIATIAAGSRQQSRFIAMMEDYDRTLELVETAQDSAGRSNEQFAKYADTITYKLNQVKNSWEELRVSFLNSEDYGKGLNFVNDFLNTIKNIDPKILIADVAIFGIIGKNIITNIIKALRDGTNEVSKAYADMAKRIGNNAAIEKIYQKQYQKIGQESRAALEAELNKLSIKFNRNKLTITSTEDLLRLGQLAEIEETIYYRTEQITRMTRTELKQAYEEVNQVLTQKNGNQEATINYLVSEKGYNMEVAKLMVEQVQSLKSAQNEQQTLTTKIKDERIIEGDINNQLKIRLQLLAQEDRQRKNNLKTLKDIMNGQIVSGLANGIAYSLTTGITTALSTGDTKAALEAAGSTFIFSISSTLTQVLSQVISKALGAITLEGLSSFLMAAVPIILPVIAAVAGFALTNYFSQINQMRREAEKTRAEVEKLQKEAEERAKKANELADQKKSYAEESKELKKLIDEYEKYHDGTLKTKEEQERTLEIIEEIKEKYPELVSGEEILLDNAHELYKNRQNELKTLSEQVLKERLITSELEKQKSLKEDQANKQDLEIAKEVLNTTANGVQLVNQTVKETNYSSGYNGVYGGFGGRNNVFGSLYSQLVSRRLSDVDFDAESGRAIYDVSKVKWTGFQSIEDLAKSVSKNDYAKYYGIIYNGIYGTNINFEDLASESKPNQIAALKFIDQWETNNEEILEKSNDAIKKLEDSFDGKEALDRTKFKNNLYDYFMDLYNNTDIAEILSERYKNDYNNSENLDLEAYTVNFIESLETLSDERQKEIEKFLEENSIENFDFSLKDKYIDSDAEDKIITGIIERWTQEIENIKDNISESGILDALGEGLSLKKEDLPDDYIKLSGIQALAEDAIAAFGENFATDGLSAIGDIAKQLGEEAVDRLPEILSLFGGINLDNIDTKKNLFTTLVQELNGTKEEAEKIFDEVIADLQKKGVLTLTFDAEKGSEEFFKNLNEELDNAFNDKVYEITLHANGDTLSSDEVEALQEYEFEDWLDYYNTENGTLKNVENLTKEHTQKINEILQKGKDTLQYFGNQVEASENWEEIEKAGIENGIQAIQVYKKLSKNVDNLTKEEKEMWEIMSKMPFIAEGVESYDNLMQMTAKAVAKGVEQIDEALKNAKEEYEKYQDVLDKEKSLEDARKNYTEKREEAQKKIDDQIKKNEEDEKSALKEINDALKDIEEQEKTILEKEQDIVEKTQKLNEALYGTENYLSKRDSLQNYTDKIDQLAAAAEKAKKALDDPDINDNIAELVKNYGDAIHQEIVYQKALNSRKEDQKNQILGYLQGFGSEYFTVVDGFLQANYSAIDNARMNDQLKDQIYQYLDDYNKVQKEIIEGEDKYNDLLKDMKERRKSALSDMVNLQKDTAEILKESYEKEIEDVKEKYDAIKEADDEYLDALQEAIDKQRRLREEEDKWNDLATKEKKLSLISRDTSGSQQKETLKLQEEIEKDRQSLLDDSIDNILNTLKETYEEQQKEREEEVQYQEQMIEDMDFMKQAMEIIQSMNGSSENYLTWLTENDPEYMEGSPLEQELYIEEHANDLAPFEEYAAITNSNFQQYLEITAQEVNEAVSGMSDNVAEYLERSHQDTIDKVLEEQETTQEALNQAYADLDEAKQKLVELDEKVNESYENYDTVIRDGVIALNEAYDNQKQVIEDTKQDLIKAENDYNETLLSVYGTCDITLAQIASDAENSLVKYHNLQMSYANDIEQIKKSALETVRDMASVAGDDFVQNTAQNLLNQLEEQKTQLQVQGPPLPPNDYRNDAEYQQLKNEYEQHVRGLEIAENILRSHERTYNIEAQKVEEANKKKDDSFLGMGAILFPDKQVDQKIVEARDYWQDEVNRLKAQIKVESSELNKYATGGLVDYTGPAWVDGTPNKPEAFLSAEDTARIGAAAQLLSNLPILNSSSIADNSYSSNVGDTTIEVHINIENVSSEQDIDDMINRVRDDIVSMSNQIGNPVLLNK